jgi:hypothetical protein
MTTGELLQELHQRHIEVEVCGDKLQMHAPKGALTQELKACLQEQKTAVIAALSATASKGVAPTDTPDGQDILQAEPSTTTAEEERAERFLPFAETVSRIAAVFPGTCKIERLPPNMTVAEWLTQQQQQIDEAVREARQGVKYTPFLLPPLPRPRCPAKVLTEQQVQVPHTKQTYRCPRLIPCKQKPLANGWCQEHQLAQVMLDIGAQVSYPALQLHQYRGIDDGKATWEEYAVRAPRRWLTHDIEQVKIFTERSKANE